MPVFDQYEVEPTSVYSGSYTDNAIFGTMLNNATTLAKGYTPLGDPNPQTVRRNIGSKINGPNASYPNINNMWIPASILHGYASGSYLGKQQRFESYYSNEYWYDSYMPNIVELYQRGGFSLVSVDYYDLNKDFFGSTLNNELSGSSFGIYPFPKNNSVNISLYMMEEPNTSGIYMPPVPNYLWYKNFPFQNYYKNINRYEKFTNILPNSYTVAYNFEGTSITPVSSSNLIASITIKSDLTSTSPYSYLIVGDYMNAPTLAFPARLKFGTISPNNLFKTFFGIGDGTPALTSRGPTYVYSNNIANGFSGTKYILAYGVNVRGFKYGIRSAEPEKTKIVYRMGKYGQFRDMLEGRPNTTMLTPAGNDDYTGLPINRTLTYPLEYGFASGSLIYSQSIDYLTATNPSYNPYDSGIYDIYYRSGQPFFDRPNED